VENEFFTNSDCRNPNALENRACSLFFSFRVIESEHSLNNLIQGKNCLDYII
jgi:hypothetical protein